VTPVHLFTSGDEAELFVNGKSQGRREPGELKAVAYRDGKEWATTRIETTGAPARLAMTADRAQIRADGLDLSFITVRVADRDGRTAPRANQKIRFSVRRPR
jgi:beta-galactosidase